MVRVNGMFELIVEGLSSVLRIPTDRMLGPGVVYTKRGGVEHSHLATGKRIGRFEPGTSRTQRPNH